MNLLKLKIADNIIILNNYIMLILKKYSKEKFCLQKCFLNPINAVKIWI